MDKKFEMLQGLFINTAKANCSIYESGKMCFNCLAKSEKYTLDYVEVDKENRLINLSYDFYIFNYHHITMGWLDTSIIKEISGTKFTIILETLPNNPFVYCSNEHFDGYLVLDPTLKALEKNVYSFPRPLEENNGLIDNNSLDKEIPIIGTFGFATIGKGFEKVIKAVNDEFDKAIIRINIPSGDYVDKKNLLILTESLEKCHRKPDILLQISNHFFDKEALVKWCQENTLNVFLYSRNIPGLSATTDQAIISGKPLAVSTDYTFRHIHPYIKPYPFRSLKESIRVSKTEVETLKNVWTKEAFTKKFETVLTLQNVKKINSSNQKHKLKIKDNIKHRRKINLNDFIPPIFRKIYRKFKNQQNNNKIDKYKPLTPFIHPVVNTYSQFNEDIFLDLLFGSKLNGFYVDIGANHPVINSNTYRFYQRGWNGINIEPNTTAFEQIKLNRERDINLNIAISESEGIIKLYLLSDDTTLSTLDLNTANDTAQRLNLNIKSTDIDAVPLSQVLDNNLREGHSIDLMSIDAEGHDLAVIRSNNWLKYRPSLIVIESNYQFEEIRDFLDKQDYLHIFNNNFNAIFLDKLTKNNDLLNKFHWDFI